MNAEQFNAEMLRQTRADNDKLRALNAELIQALQTLVARVDANPMEAAGIALLAIEGRTLLKRCSVLSDVHVS